MTASVLSLCTGYGGLDLAVETVIPGAHTRWVSDIDRDACAVQAVRFADAEQLGDLKLVDWSALVGQVDIITAGYPCQPFSTAGRRQGTDDPRHLWPWVADAIRTVRPRLVVLENVAGHLVLGFDAVLADLAEMGMSARWGIVRASDAGAPHRRERLFVVAYATVADGRAAQLDGVAASCRPAAESGERHSDAAAHADGTRSQGTEPAGRCKLPARCVAVDADGTARHGRTGLSGAAERTGLANGGAVCWGRFTPAINRWERHMGRTAPAPLVVGTRQLNARFVEWMMGLSDGWVTDIVPNRRALKVLGNGVVPQQAALALGALL